MYINCKTWFSFKYGTFQTEELATTVETGVTALALTNIRLTIMQIIRMEHASPDTVELTVFGATECLQFIRECLAAPTLIGIWA